MNIPPRLRACVVPALALVVGTVFTFGVPAVQAVTRIAQIGDDIDGEGDIDTSGYSVALSSDGSRVAIGAPGNAGNGADAGHARVHGWNGTSWVQVGADIDGGHGGDRSGASVAMSSDGNHIVIGSPGYQSSSGRVRVYTWSGTAWVQVGSDILSEAAGDETGYSVAMSADGSRIAVGAPSNDGNGTDAGHVRVHTWNGSAWIRTGGDIDGEAGTDLSGFSVAMSADGDHIVIGASGNDGNGSAAGHVRVYTWNGTTWNQTGSDIDGETAGSNLGWSVAMSADGTRLAAGAPSNDGNDLTDSNRGHVRAYALTNGQWEQVGSDIDGESVDDSSGQSIAMSADGARIAIGAPANAANGPGAGHARIYTLTNGTWTQSGPDLDGEAQYNSSGWAVALSPDGTHVAVGATSNDGNDLTDTIRGHVRVYGITDFTAPAAPTISSVTNGNGSLTVAFTPGADGGSPITNYKYSLDGTTYTALNPAATTSPFTISGLTNGTTYAVTIKAVNEAGDSVSSNAVSGTPAAPSSAPGNPTTSTTPVASTAAVAPTTTAAPTSTTEATKPKEKSDALPKTGGDASTIVAYGVVLATAGLILASRRRMSE